LVSAVDQALMQNYVSFLRFDKGMDLNTTISWAGALLAVIGVLAKIGSGWFFDRYSIRGITAFWLLLAISIFLGLPVAGVGTLLLFIVTRGIAHGGMIVDAPVISRHYFGLEQIGLTLGIVELCVNLGFAVGPPVFGWLADTYGNFSTGLVVYGVVALVGTALLVPVKPRFWTPPAMEPRVAHSAEPAAAAR
jgi:MFS transporter, OFA family, oxalate/formate antiporter